MSLTRSGAKAARPAAAETTVAVERSGACCVMLPARVGPPTAPDEGIRSVSHKGLRGGVGGVGQWEWVLVVEMCQGQDDGGMIISVCIAAQPSCASVSQPRAAAKGRGGGSLQPIGLRHSAPTRSSRRRVKVLGFSTAVLRPTASLIKHFAVHHQQVWRPRAMHDGGVCKCANPARSTPFPQYQFLYPMYLNPTRFIHRLASLSATTVGRTQRRIDVVALGASVRAWGPLLPQL